MFNFELDFSEINNTKNIYEGWTPADIAREIEPSFRGLITNEWRLNQLVTKQDFAKWVGDQQPFVKKPVKEVVDFYWSILQQIKKY